MIFDFPLRTARFFLLVSVFCCLCAADASPRSDAWKLRRTNPAAAESQLQNVVRQTPNDAKAWWFLTLIQHDQKRAADAMRSLESAKRSDPTLTFSSPEAVGKIELSLRRALAKSGEQSTGEIDRTPQNRNSQSRPNSSNNLDASATISRAFAQSGVFIAPELAGRADRAKIEKAARASAMPIRVAVIGALPTQARSVGQVAQVLHKQLDLGDGLMIVVSDRPRALGIYGADFDKPTLDDIAARTAKTFDSEGYAEGIARVISLAGEEKAKRDAAGRNLLLLIFGIPAALILWNARRRKKRGATDANAARALAQTEIARVQMQWEPLSNELRHALAAELAPQRREELLNAQNRAQQAAFAAGEKLKYASSAADFDATRVASRAAETELQQARAVLGNREARSASPNAPQNANVWADGDYEIPPLGENLPDARAGYALDFFTSQPVLRSQMVPVEIDLGGRRRRVWASPQSAAQSAQNPQIAASGVSGNPRAWFDTPSYNPWTNFGDQMLQMMAMQSVVNAVVGGGYSGGWNSSYGGSFGGFSSHYDDNRNNQNNDWGNAATTNQSAPQASPYDSDEPVEAGEASLDAPFANDNWNAPAAPDFGSSFAQSSSFGSDRS